MKREATINPDLELAVLYAPRAIRSRVATAAVLDARLADVVRSTRETMIGRIRLAWWREGLERLDPGAPPPAEPALAAVAAARLPPLPLRRMVDGWEALLDTPIAEDALDHYAAGRGGGLAELVEGLAGIARPGAEAGARRWALADLARHAGDAALAARALALAAEESAASGAPAAARWPRPLRSLGALDVMAQRDVARGVGALEPARAPGRVWRALRMRLRGR